MKEMPNVVLCPGLNPYIFTHVILQNGANFCRLADTYFDRIWKTTSICTQLHVKTCRKEPSKQSTNSYVGINDGFVKADWLHKERLETVLYAQLINDEISSWTDRVRGIVYLCDTKAFMIKSHCWKETQQTDFATLSWQRFRLPY